MKIFDEKRPLGIEIVFNYDGFKMKRPIAELFKTEKGLIFFDIFWPEASLNPIHHIDGEITGEGPWKINDDNDHSFTIFVMKENDPLLEEYNNWIGYTKHAKYPADYGKRRFEQELKRIAGYKKG